MKVFVVGANGQVGRHLVEKMIQDGDEVVAGLRKTSQEPYFKELGAETVPFDLEENDIDEIADKFKDVDKVVFTAGSGGSTGADKTIIVDLDGAVKTIEASKKANIQHLVLVSSFDTSRKAFEGDLKPYTIAKHYADQHLRASDVPYTIVHPGLLSNDEGTGKVKLAEEVERGEIPREDVASVIHTVLHNDASVGKEFQIVSGDQDITEAVKNY